MRYVRAMMSGIFIPSILLPFLLVAASLYGNTALLQVKFLHFIPLLWGIWNILYIGVFREAFPGKEEIKLLLSGALLGLLVAIIGVFWLNLPKLIGFPKHLQLLPLIGAPVLYAILWALFMKPLNKIVGLNLR